MYVYLDSMKRVIPITHTAKSRKLKSDVDSQLSNANVPNDLQTKKKRKSPQENEELSTYAYSIEASEMFFYEMSQFDRKA